MTLSARTEKGKSEGKRAKKWERGENRRKEKESERRMSCDEECKEEEP